MKKKVGIIKRYISILLVFLLSINSFATSVSDNDGSAFITKAEFDALRSSFQSQIDTYNQKIDSMIDQAIASYLSGVKISYETQRDVIGYSSTGLCTVTSNFPEWSEGKVAWSMNYTMDKIRTTTNSTHVGIQHFKLNPHTPEPFFEMNIITKTAKASDAGSSSYAEASGFYKNNWLLNTTTIQWQGASSSGTWTTTPDSCNLMLQRLYEIKNKNLDVEDASIAVTQFYHGIAGGSAGYDYAFNAVAPEWGVTHLERKYDTFCVNYKNQAYQRFVNESYFNNWMTGVSGEWNSLKPDGSRYHTAINLPWYAFNGLDDESYFLCLQKYNTVWFKPGDATRGFGLDMDESKFTPVVMPYFGFDTRFTTWDNLYTTKYDLDLDSIQKYTGAITLYDGHLPLWAGTPLNFVNTGEVITIAIPAQTDEADRNIFIKYEPFKNLNPEDQTDIINYTEVKIIDEFGNESPAEAASITGISNLKGFKITRDTKKVKFTAQKDGFLFLKVSYDNKDKGGVWVMPTTFTAEYNK